MAQADARKEVSDVCFWNAVGMRGDFSLKNVDVTVREE